MNKVFKVVFSHVLGRHVVVSELARNQGRKSAKDNAAGIIRLLPRLSRLAIALGLGFACALPNAFAKDYYLDGSGHTLDGSTVDAAAVSTNDRIYVGDNKIDGDDVGDPTGNEGDTTLNIGDTNGDVTVKKLSVRYDGQVKGSSNGITINLRGFKNLNLVDVENDTLNLTGTGSENIEGVIKAKALTIADGATFTNTGLNYENASVDDDSSTGGEDDYSEDSEIHPSLRITGELTNNGTFSNQDWADIQADTLTNNGTFNNMSGDVYVKNLTNKGSFTNGVYIDGDDVGDGGKIEVENTLTNSSGAIFTNKTNAEVYTTALTNSSKFENAATLYVDTSGEDTGEETGGTITNSGTFTNTGTVAGALDVDDDDDGNAVSDVPAELTGVKTIENSGTFTNSANALLVASNITNTSGEFTNEGTIIGGQTGTYTIVDNGDDEEEIFTPSEQTGVEKIENSGTFNNEGEIDTENFTNTDTGTFNNEEDGYLQVKTFNNTGTIKNAGEIDVLGDSTLGTITNSGQLAIVAGTSTATAINGENGQINIGHEAAGLDAKLQLLGNGSNTLGTVTMTDKGILDIGSAIAKATQVNASDNATTQINGGTLDLAKSSKLGNVKVGEKGTTFDLDNTQAGDNGNTKITMTTLNSDGNTDINTSSADEGQVQVGTITGNGNVNLNLNKTAANQLTSGTTQAIAQQAANVIKVTDPNNDNLSNRACNDFCGHSSEIGRNPFSKFNAEPVQS